MPRGDRTGPTGMGPMTGRGAGYCAGYDVPGYANPVPRFGGRAFGGGGWRGGGGGRGWRHMYYATGLPGWARGGYAPAWGTPPPTREGELDALRTQAEQLQSQLEAIQARMQELKGEE